MEFVSLFNNAQLTRVQEPRIYHCGYLILRSAAFLDF